MNELREIQIAALLHDIGKFWQRAQGKIQKDHEEYGKDACERLRLGDNIPKLVWAHGKDHWKDIDPSMRSFALIIKEADQLSAAEREEREEREFQSIYKRSIPIFNQVDIGKGKPFGNWIYDTYGPLSLEKQSIFPKQKPEIEANRYKLYEELWDKFCREYKSLDTVSPEGFLDTFFYLWQKYATFIPSAPAVTKPDVSLFDHSKTTAAIAICLYKYLKSVDKLRNETFIQNRTDKRYLLIGGDISGVQRFIYSITSKGAAKGLRGRSFYLQLLSEAIAKYILHRLRLPITNLLFCAGGHFYIIASNITNITKDLEEIRSSITEKLLKIHRGELYLALEYIPLSGEDFEKERYGEKLKELGSRLAERKKRKFAEILELYDGILESIDRGGTKDTCEICGSEENLGIEEDIKICRFCKSFEELAEEIAKAKYLVEVIGDRDKREGSEGTWRDIISKFDIRYEFHTYLKGKEELARIEAEKINIYKLNDTNFLEEAYLARDAKSPISFGFKFIAKATPITDKGTIKSFDELADESQGIKQWAILRMDVDDLGKIISQGLKEDRTISRLSTLSSMLSLFFTAWIEKICEEYKENIYAIYSGGDDLFLVGSWNIIPEIAKRIYGDFREFTCQNPNITLSGGIFIAPAVKFPLYQAAELARNAEELAKELSGKNAITFFETPLKWEKFDNGVTNLKDSLLNSSVPRAILQKLYGVYVEFDRQRKKYGDISAKYDDRYGRWRWLLAYSIARMKRKEKDLDEKLEKIHTLARENIECLPIAVRWVELLTRKEKEK